MTPYIVTVKLAKSQEHNPNDKKTAECPASHGSTCTDSTGEHHSFIALGSDITEVQATWTASGYHVTRVETARLQEQRRFAAQQAVLHKVMDEYRSNQ
jgi:hypothetical protein